MSNNRRISFDLPTTTEGVVIEVVARYTKGDPYSSEQQGFWIGMTPVKVEENWRTTRAFSGLKAFDSTATRFSAKKLEAVRDKVRHQIMNGTPTDRYAMMLQRVVEQAGLKLERTVLAEKHAERAAEVAEALAS
tara:strand:+ start:181212 stop:181613 length:402 start_codon:yes stop_codon:yes gene_type:complete